MCICLAFFHDFNCDEYVFEKEWFPHCNVDRKNDTYILIKKLKKSKFK